MDLSDGDLSEPEEINEKKSDEDNETVKKTAHQETVHQRVVRVASGQGSGPGYALGRLLMDAGGPAGVNLKSPGGGGPAKSPGERPTPMPRRLPSENGTSGDRPQESPPPPPPKPTGWRCDRCAYDDNYITDNNCRVCRHSRH